MLIGDQPAARRPGPAGSLAGGDPGCRQGRVPALGGLADPDHRPRGAARGRPRDAVRRRDDGQHEAGARRDRTGGGRSRWSTTRRNDITPQSIIKPIDMSLVRIAEGDYVTVPTRAGEPGGGTDARRTRAPADGTGGADARGRQEVRVREGGAVARPHQVDQGSGVRWSAVCY